MLHTNFASLQTAYKTPNSVCVANLHVYLSDFIQFKFNKSKHLKLGPWSLNFVENEK